MNRGRLLNVARALRESPNPEKFSMDVYAHPCGTPACAFGHYAARPDLQSAFRLEDGTPVSAEGICRMYYLEDVLDHFGITIEDARELFSGGGDPFEVEDEYRKCGCGGAKTAIEAAEFVERWVEAHEAGE